MSSGKELRKNRPVARAALHGAGRARHAGHDRLRRPARHRPAEARRNRRRLRCVGRGRRRSSARSRRSKAAASWASPARREKCDYVVEELGFDACVNHRERRSERRAGGGLPDGIDVYFENVGGEVLAAVLPILNVGARIPLCGVISEYNATNPPKGTALRPFLVKRATAQGVRDPRPPASDGRVSRRLRPLG